MINKIKTFFYHPGIKKYFFNISWLFIEKVFRMVVGLFVGVWVARYLGPSRYGLLSYAQSFVGLFSPIATLGLNEILVRELVKYPEKEKELLGTAFILKLFGAVLTLIVLYIAIYFTSNDFYTNSLIFIIASALIFQAFNIIDLYFQSIVKSKYIVLANSFSLFVSSIVKIFFILTKAPLIAFAIVVLFDTFIVAIGYLYVYYIQKKDFFLKDIRFNLNIAKYLLKNSWPMILSGISVMLYARIDQIMLKEMTNSYEVGQYSVAIRLIEQFDFLSVIIVKSISPSITSAKKFSSSLYKNRLLNLYRIMFSIFIITFLFVCLFGKDLVLLLYGKQYKVAATLFVLSGFRTLFTNFGVASGQYIINENLFNYSLIFTVSSAFINIILNYVFIPLYGAYGALIVTIISFTFKTFIVHFIFKKTRENAFLMIKGILTFYKFTFRGVI
ncbi:flippase [Marinitoga sp. 1135]|uniref:flippase n=1 Tax=Marinitoga sp. 1135 TaxID=1643333 RepID=UPI001585E3A8|nr:flippase [Marinitoga sp. 1135]NUU95813.1 flippase [Marinitoga sp. 1135]